jgi:hypothetical protein
MRSIRPPLRSLVPADADRTIAAEDEVELLSHTFPPTKMRRRTRWMVMSRMVRPRSHEHSYFCCSTPLVSAWSPFSLPKIWVAADAPK